MRNAMKIGSLGGVLVLSDDAFSRLGTLGVVGGGLLALALVMF
jgi:hypothetical protein